MKLFKVIVLLIMIYIFVNKLSANYEKLAYDLEFKDLDGSSLNLSDYKGKVIVVVTVASQCGFTNQYEDMQKVWEQYQDRGVVMLGVPSNDFGNQEPGNNKEIKNFCEAKFGISFPMTEKISVKLKIAEMPSNSNWLKFYGVGILTGIGFTMSLFVGNLAFVDYSNQMDGVKIGVLTGSFLSAIVGYFMLLMVTKKK